MKRVRHVTLPLVIDKRLVEPLDVPCGAGDDGPTLGAVSNAAASLAGTETGQRLLVPVIYQPWDGKTGTQLVWDAARAALYSRHVLTAPEAQAMAADEPVAPWTHPWTGAIEFELHAPPAPAPGPGSTPMVVKTLTNKTMALSVSLSESVGTLKQRVQRASGIPEDQQRLIFKGVQLEDKRVLSDYGMAKDAVLNLVLRLRGGMMHVSSGRADYCTAVHEHAGTESSGPTTEARELIITYAKKDGPGTLHLVTHPDASPGHVIRVLRAETEPDYFAQLVGPEWRAWAKNKAYTQLSRAASHRYTAALLETLGELPEEGDE